MSSSKPSSIRLIAFASLLGTTIEWYDFFLYNTAAALVFNKLFFPTFDPFVGTLLAFSTYTVGFVARPVGAIVIGHYGDKVGRRSMLVLTLVMMGVATCLIGALPTYATIGPWAAVLLVLLRIVQGFGVGGQWGGAVLMTVEHAPAGQRGFYGSWPQIGVPGRAPDIDDHLFAVRKAASGSVSLLGLACAVPDEHCAGRRRSDHPPEGARDAGLHEDEGDDGLWCASRSSRSCADIRSRCCRPPACVPPKTARSTSTAPSCSSTRRSTRTSTASVALNGIMIASACEFIAVPAYGALTDRIGRRPVYMFGAIMTAVLAFPLFWLFDTRSTPLVWLALLLVFLCSHAPMYAPQGAFFSELFGTSVRYSGASLGAQLSAAVAGGFSPLIATALLPKYGPNAIAIYIIGMALITIVAVWSAVETMRHDLDQS